MKVEQAKAARQRQKLEQFVRFEPSIRPTLDKVRDKQSRIGQNQTGGEKLTRRVTAPGPTEHGFPQRVGFASRETPATSQPPAESSTAGDANDDTSTIERRLERSAPRSTPIPTSSRARAAPIDSSSDREIPVPELDSDGRVVCAHPLGRDEWDQLSDSSGEDEKAEFVTLKKAGQPYVDVHAFLQSVYVREQRREPSSDEDEMDGDDDESASVY
jgi:hypothetical protein